MFIAIDTGGTNTRIIATTSLEEVDVAEAVVFPTPQIFSEGVNKIISTIQSLAPTVDAIAMGVAGGINTQGEIVRAPNLSDWQQKPLQKTLADKFTCSVYIRNDAEMGALGEAYFGAVTQLDFVYLTWGTGVGFAEVRFQNEVATVGRPEDRTPVHKLEAKIGGSFLQQRFGKPAKDLTAEEWNEVLSDLRTDLPPLVHHYGFDTVVFGGGVTLALGSRIAETLNDLPVKVILTQLNGQSGLYGSLALLREKSIFD